MLKWQVHYAREVSLFTWIIQVQIYDNMLLITCKYLQMMFQHLQDKHNLSILSLIEGLN